MLALEPMVPVSPYVFVTQPWVLLTLIGITGSCLGSVVADAMPFSVTLPALGWHPLVPSSTTTRFQVYGSGKSLPNCLPCCLEYSPSVEPAVQVLVRL